MPISLSTSAGVATIQERQLIKSGIWSSEYWVSQKSTHVYTETASQA